MPRPTRGRPRNPSVHSTESVDQTKSAPANAQSSGQADPGSEDYGRLKAGGERLISAQVRALERYLLQTIKRGNYSQVGLEDKKTLLRAQLDLVQLQVQSDPELRAEFEKHSLFRSFGRYGPLSKGGKVPTLVWIPTDRLSDEEKKVRRAREAKKKKEYRHRKAQELKK